MSWWGLALLVKLKNNNKPSLSPGVWMVQYIRSDSDANIAYDLYIYELIGVLNILSLLSELAMWSYV